MLTLIHQSNVSNSALLSALRRSVPKLAVPARSPVKILRAAVSASPCRPSSSTARPADTAVRASTRNASLDRSSTWSSRGSPRTSRSASLSRWALVSRFCSSYGLSSRVCRSASLIMLARTQTISLAIRSCGRSSPPAAAPVVYATTSRPPSGPNVLRQTSLHRSAEPPLTRPLSQPQAQYGHVSRPSGNSSMDMQGARALPYPSAGGSGTAAYQREVRRDGDWVSFGGGAGQGQGNTYSGWSAPR